MKSPIISRMPIPTGSRVLAAADAYLPMIQPRPYRPALSPRAAAAELETMGKSGGLDPEAVRAVSKVLTAAGHQWSRPSRTAWPARLSEREVEMLRLICRGGTKKQVASLLSISPSTVDRHVRHSYDKAGVQTHAGSTLFAIEQDLLK